MFSTDDLSDYLAAFEQALVGADTMQVDFSPAERVEVAGSVESVPPYCYADPADIARLALAVGSVLTIGGTDYAVTAIEPDSSGLSLLWLED